MHNFRGKTIFVTGGTGFVGSHLVEALVKEKTRVVIPYRDINPNSYFFSKKLNTKSVLAQCDIRDVGRLLEIMVKYEVDYVFHLAAQAIVPTAYYNPHDTLSTNIMGTVNVLDVVRQYPHVRGVVVASSDKAYGKSKTIYSEQDPLLGDHPYEVSKSSADLIAYSYFKTYGVPVVVTRFGNIYGEGDLSFSRIIPGAMEAIVKKKTLEIRSDGTHVRQYLYVKDVVNGYIGLMRQIDTVKGEAFNFGSKEELSVLDLLYLIQKTLHKKIQYKTLNIAKNEIVLQSLNYSKIVKTLNWKPRYSLAKTLRSIFNWYAEYFK